MPPTSAGIGGGNGVVDVGVVEVGVDDVDEVAVPDVVVVVVVVVDPPGDFGADPWKSSHDSVRIVFRPELTVSALELTVYVIPSFSATKVPLPDWVAVRISLAPSWTRTPRYSYPPPDDVQMATREVSVLPNRTTVPGQRAVESR